MDINNLGSTILRSPVGEITYRFLLNMNPVVDNGSPESSLKGRRYEN